MTGEEDYLPNQAPPIKMLDRSDLRDRISQLRDQRDELVAAIEELGIGLFGTPETNRHGKSWRDAKADWWQRCRRAVEAVERNP